MVVSGRHVRRPEGKRKVKRQRLGLPNGFLSPRPDSGVYHGYDSRFPAGRVTGPEAAVVGENEEEEEGEGDDAVVVVVAAATEEEEEEGLERRCRCKLESCRSVLKACDLTAFTQCFPRSSPCSLPARALSSPSCPSPSCLFLSGPGLFRCRSVHGCGSAALHPARQDLRAFLLCPQLSVCVPKDMLMWLLRCCRRPLLRDLIGAGMRGRVATGRVAAVGPFGSLLSQVIRSAAC